MVKSSKKTWCNGEQKGQKINNLDREESYAIVEFIHIHKRYGQKGLQPVMKQLHRKNRSIIIAPARAEHTVGSISTNAMDLFLLRRGGLVNDYKTGLKVGFMSNRLEPFVCTTM